MAPSFDGWFICFISWKIPWMMTGGIPMTEVKPPCVDVFFSWTGWSNRRPWASGAPGWGFGGSTTIPSRSLRPWGDFRTESRMTGILVEQRNTCYQRCAYKCRKSGISSVSRVAHFLWCIQRSVGQEEIDNFQPQKLWSPVLNVEVSGCQLQFEWEHGETQALRAGCWICPQEPGCNKWVFGEDHVQTSIYIGYSHQAYNSSTIWLYTTKPCYLFVTTAIDKRWAECLRLLAMRPDFGWS